MDPRSPVGLETSMQCWRSGGSNGLMYPLKGNVPRYRDDLLKRFGCGKSAIGTLGVIQSESEKVAEEDGGEQLCANTPWHLPGEEKGGGGRHSQEAGHTEGTTREGGRRARVGDCFVLGLAGNMTPRDFS